MLRRVGLFPTIVAYLVMGYLLLPLVTLLPVAFTSAGYVSFPPPGLSLQWFREYATESKWILAALMSLRVGLLATAIATVIGTLAAWVIVRSRFFGKGVFEIVVTSPMFMPYIILALGLYFIFAKWGLLGTMIGIAIGQAVLGIPLVTIVVSASLRGVDPVLERAAASLGASRARITFTVILPLILPGIAAGAFLAFLISWDELLIPLFVASIWKPTLPVLLWSTISAYYSPGVAAVSVLLILISVISLIMLAFLRKAGEKILGRRRGR